MRFETEGTIRQSIAEGLRAKRLAQKKQFDPRELDSPVLERWFRARVATARRRNLLLTEQQLEDVRNARPLRRDDRARYIGPTRLEVSPATGKGILRPHGQTGSISEVQRGVGGRVILTFVPDVSKEVLDLAEHTDIEVMSLQTAMWTELERIP